MKRIRIVLLIVTVLVASTAGAARKPKSKKKAAVAAERVDTVSVDSFSYAIGIAQTNGLMNYLTQRMGVDTKYMSDFLVGFDKTELSEDDKRTKARMAGTEIRQQLESQLIQQVNRQIDDSLDVLNRERFINGFRDALSGAATMREDSAQAVTNRQMEYYRHTRMEKKYGQNRIDGEAYLKENVKRDSVKTTDSGLQYKVITMGSGATPVATDRVKVNYEGKLIDGTVFDSSYQRKQPATFACNQVIKGWTEALTMMPVGSKWELYIPQQLGYGDREAGKIPPYSTLIFTVELLEIVK